MRYASYIIVLLIGGLIAWAIIPRDNNEKRELKDQIKTLLHERDSILIREKYLAGRDSMWARTRAQDRDSLLTARKQSKYWKDENKKFRADPPVHYSEPQLDSAVDALISARFHKTP